MPRKIREISVEATDPASDDFIPLSGAVNGGRKLNLAKYASNRLALRASRPQAISDGSTTNRAIRFTPGSRGNLAGAPVATWAGFVAVPSSNPSVAPYIFALSSTTTSSMFQAWSIGAPIGTDGSLVIQALGASTATDRRLFTYSGFRAAYSGQTIFLEVYFVAGTTNPVVRVNGTDISSSFVLSYGSGGVGTAPPWLSPSLVNTYSVLGFNAVAGDAPLGCWINAALTDADRTYWLTHGVPPEWILLGGNVAKVISDLPKNAYFDEATTDWFNTGSSAGITLNTTNTPGMLYWNTSGTGSAERRFALAASALSSAPVSGDDVTLYIDVDAAHSTLVLSALNAGAANAGLSNKPIVAGLNIIHFKATGTIDTFRFTTTSVGTTRIKTFLLNVGALGYPVVGPDRFVRDGTRISPPIDGYMVGMRPLSTESRSFFRFTTTHSGNIQAFGQSAFDTVGAYKLIRWTVTNENVATFTVSLGSSSGGTDYVSGLSVPTGTTEVDLMGQPNISNSLWVACTDTGSISHTLTYERIQT